MWKEWIHGVDEKLAVSLRNPRRRIKCRRWKKICRRILTFICLRSWWSI